MVLLTPGFGPPFVARLRAASPVPIVTHVAASLVALAAGPWQFNTRLRSRLLNVHRWTGRVYVLAVLAGGTAGLVLSRTAQEGRVTHAGFGLLAIAWLATTLQAYRVIRGGDALRHREWMMRSFALTFAAVTLRLMLPLELALGVPFAIAYRIVSWACWLPNVLFAEWLIRNGRSPRRIGGLAAATALAIILAAAPTRAAQQTPAWPDTFTSRLEALALLQTLNADLLAARSSTSTLEGWCRDHQLAAPAQIVADGAGGSPVTPTSEQLQRLAVSAPSEVRYRHVRLRCGTRILSEAENWYVPARLTADMNRTLEKSDAPFGRVVAPLQPYRRTFSVTMLWAPLPDGWERGTTAAAGGGALDIPAALFEHRAVLYRGADNQPFSEVREVYQRGVLAFPPPPAR